MLSKFKAVVWLHFLRFWRYRLSFIGLMLSEVLWILLFILAILLFAPKEYLDIACRNAFWVVICWSIIQMNSMIVGSWMNFFISLGMIEEHLIRGISPFRVILGRIIPSSIVSLLSTLLIAIVLNSIFEVNVLSARSPLLILVGLVFIVVKSLSYGLSIASLSIRTGIPHHFLEILNFMVIGILTISVESMRPPLSYLLLLVPYTAPSQLIKMGISGREYMFTESLTMSVVVATVMVLMALYLVNHAKSWLLRNGVRAIGRM